MKPLSSRSLPNEIAFRNERTGRKLKRKQQPMMIFRSAESANLSCQALSVIYTASAKDENLSNIQQAEGSIQSTIQVTYDALSSGDISEHKRHFMTET